MAEQGRAEEDPGDHFANDRGLLQTAEDRAEQARCQDHGDERQQNVQEHLRITGWQSCAESRSVRAGSCDKVGTKGIDEKESEDRYDDHCGIRDHRPNATGFRSRRFTPHDPTMPQLRRPRLH